MFDDFERDATGSLTEHGQAQLNSWSTAAGLQAE